MRDNDRVEERERIRRIRLMRRWDQAHLADRAGFSVSIVSQIETGRLTPSPEQIEGIAQALGYSPRFLSSEMSLGPTSRPWLRAYADAGKKEADARVATCTTAVECVRQLRLKPLPDLLPVFTGDADDDHDVEDIAQEVRALAGLDADAVVGNMIRAAERLGCLVLPFESELGRHLGMSVRSDDVPIICVVNSNDVPGDRQRFTVAHEVGHLVLHGAAKPPADGPEAARMESQANRFAAAFLGPADSLVDCLAEMGGRVTLTALTRVKAVWGVAIKSLVGRYKALGVIGSDQARSLYKQISARGWNRNEPVDVPSEQAQWLGRVLELKAQVEDTGEAARILAGQIGANPTDLFAFASWDLRAAADVVSLATHRESAVRHRSNRRSRI